MFLEISQKSLENACGRISFFNKVVGFPVNFAKFLRTPFIIIHIWWLLLTKQISNFILNILKIIIRLLLIFLNPSWHELQNFDRYLEVTPHECLICLENSKLGAVISSLLFRSRNLINNIWKLFCNWCTNCCEKFNQKSEG